ncbi:glycosyltransferase family 2 protein [Agaribacter flavus]|uniref:Glycosyltransferase family 2 protein n=1 Tax=Agaribacter flavus TaxID=1902781 RepID=A0ABV7FQI8_9ALTE
MQKIKSKLVTIAKDEAAYLPEWLAHHLFVGFDNIEVHVNRSSDNTIAILDKICEQYTQISYRVFDWVDVCTEAVSRNIQFVSQALAIDEARKSGFFSHISFLDVDEFWFDLKINRKINDYIVELGSQNIIYNLWVNDLPQETSFSLLDKTLSGNMSVLGKCIYPLDTSFEQLHLHIPEISQGKRYILPNGEYVIFDSNAPQAVIEEQRKLYDAIVFHRATRSEMEYVSLVYRGRPSDRFPYKRNRRGLPSQYEHTVNINLNDAFVRERNRAIERILSVCGDDLLNIAKNFVIQRYHQSISQLSEYLSNEYEILVEIFKGVHIHEVVLHFTRFRQQKLKECGNDVDKIRILAQQAIHQSVDEAVLLIKLAHSLRPTGPLINKLKDKYIAKQRALNL